MNNNNNFTNNQHFGKGIGVTLTHDSLGVTASFSDEDGEVIFAHGINHEQMKVAADFLGSTETDPVDAPAVIVAIAAVLTPHLLEDDDFVAAIVTLDANCDTFFGSGPFRGTPEQVTTASTAMVMLGAVLDNATI